MKLYSGIITAIVGAVLLLLSYLFGWVDYNFVQLIAVLIIIAGIALHIFVNYKKPTYDE
ncbi:MAG: hypothetical protein IJ209_10930 [Bacteroidaceae bacterium]|nr:hypothetical protein [Bacteroidaceae bacterium]